MGQKTHPLGFRLGITSHHLSQWYSKSTHYSQFLREDFFIRKYILQQLSGSMQGPPAGGAPSASSAASKKPFVGTDAGLSKTILSRYGDRLRVEVHVAQPKLVTGEAGAKLTELTQGIVALLTQLKKDSSDQSSAEQESASVSFHVIQIADPRIDANVLAQRIAQQLERRVAYRRVMKQSVKDAREAGVEGIKIEISGRLNGAEIARSETIKEGTLPLHTLRAHIDYCSHRAETIYGTLGIKVWIHTSPTL